MERDQKPLTHDWREKLFIIIFQADTAKGKAFDVVILWLIVLSVLAVIIESVPDVEEKYSNGLKLLEWGFTLVFTVEYFLRILCVRNKWRYMSSALGIIDLLTILPTYLGLFFAGMQYFLVIRALRLLRIFRILKLGRYVGESHLLIKALQASRFKITVFLSTVLTLVVIIGTLMYVIEGSDSGFTSIPVGMYWAIVTLTTVGFGDITPVTFAGRTLAAVVMILGYGIIAVPTGIVTVELAHQSKKQRQEFVCTGCGAGGHDGDAGFCKYCGGKLV
ncbi:MAG: potassium channel protein [Firmicutes bacterium]|nr:potassium channel protein [Bacillota bacterium]